MFKIETNYRSVPEILELSNAAIRANRRASTRTCGRAGRRRVKPALVPLEDPSTQAQFIAQRILELRDEGMPLEEMAVLYRAHFQSLEIQMELTSRGIPFQITSGLRFFEQAHIKDVAAFLRFVGEPARRGELQADGAAAAGDRSDGGREAVARAGWQAGWPRQEEPPPKLSRDPAADQGAEEGGEALGAAGGDPRRAGAGRRASPGRPR